MTAALTIQDNNLCELLIDRLNILEATTADYLAAIPHMPDDRIVQLMAQASSLERSAFRIRGACASELRNRIAVRLTGGRGKADVAGEGVTKQLAAMSKEAGVSLRTLQEDAAIHEKLGHVEVAVPLPRDFYVAALQAPEPVQALEMAAVKIGAGETYTAARFREDVGVLKTEPERAPEVEEGRWISFRASAADRAVLGHLCERWNCTPEQAIRRLLVDAGETLIKKE